MFINTFNSLNRMTKLKINIGFKVTCSINIIENYSEVIYYKLLISIMKI